MMVDVRQSIKMQRSRGQFLVYVSVSNQAPKVFCPIP